MLRSEDDGNPFVERKSHAILRSNDVSITLRIDHERETHRLDGLVHPRVGKDISTMCGEWFATKRFGCFDEVVEPTISAARGNICSRALIDAVRNPLGD